MVTTSLQTEFEECERLVIERSKEKEILEAHSAELFRRVNEGNIRSVMLGDSVKLMQIFSGGIRTGVIQKFEELITNAIREIYGRDYSISIEFDDTKSGSIWAEFFVILPNGKKVNLAKEGGGLRDVVSVLSRVLYLMMDPSQPARFLVFDENLKNLDEWRSPNGIRLIFKVIRELGIQSIFITHKEVVSSGRIDLPDAKMYRFLLEDEKTKTEEVRIMGNGHG